MWDEAGGDSALAPTHLYVQRVVLIERPGVVEAQQHLVMAGRQLPSGGEGYHVSCEDGTDQHRCGRGL